MKAILSKAPGGPETLVLEEVPDPQPEAGEVLVSIKACAINFPDGLILEDKYQFKPPRPFSPGSEVAGVIEDVGEGVTGFKSGDRVFGNCGVGGLAEKVCMNTKSIYSLPDKFSFEQGASLLYTYGTNYHGLVDRGHIKAGDSLLVLGAAGGVGVAAIELGKALGARVVGAVSSEEKAEVARRAGADDIVIYGRSPFDRDQSRALATQFKEAAGPEGFNIIYDVVGGDYSEPALRSIAWEGRFLVVGFPAGIARLPLNLTLLKSCDVCGVFWGAYTAREPEANRKNIEALFRLWDQGLINPLISETFSLDDGPKAIEKLMARQAIGKLVVTP